MKIPAIKIIYFGINSLLLIASFVPLVITYAVHNWESKPSQQGATLFIDNPRDYVSGVEVYCNDVHIGKTPTSIKLGKPSNPSGKYKKIPIWNEPPRQEMFVRAEVPKSATIATVGYDPLRFSKMTYTPIIYYSGRRLESGETARKQTLDRINQSRFWLRYEKDGCRGICPFEANLVFTIRAYTDEMRFSPRILFPFVQEHFRHLIFALRRLDYKPTEEWLKHSSQYLDLLYHQFREEAFRDQRMQAVLDDLIAYRYGFSDSSNAEDYRRVVLEILDRTEENGYFEVPSPDSEAMLRAAPHSLDVVSEEYLAAVKYYTNPGKEDESMLDSIRYQRDSCKENRLLPLEYAIENFQPPQVFNRLVYEYSRKQSPTFMRTIANYSNNQAKRLFERCLSEYDVKAPYRGLNPFEIFSNIHNPNLENRIYQFINSRGTKRDSSRINKFYNSRFQQPNVDPERLGGSIAQSVLYDEEKLRLLVQIRDKRVHDYCRNTGYFHDYLNSWLLSHLYYSSNPYFEDFLVDTYHLYVRTKTPKEIASVVRALLRCNTPKTRELVKEFIKRDSDNLQILVRQLGVQRWFDPMLPDWTEFLASLNDSELRVKAAAILAKTDTNESLSVISKWADDPDEAVREAARAAIRDCEEIQERIQKLLAGEITPDDLIPPTGAYVWNGEDYVKEAILSP